MTKRIAIYGAGGFGREVLQAIRDINRERHEWSVEGFLVDKDYAVAGDIIQDSLVLGDAGWLEKNSDVQVFVAIGNSAARARVVHDIGSRFSNSFATLVHPRAWVGDGVTLGEGVIICAGCLVTTDIRIGSHVHVNIGCTIGHDAVVNDYVTLNPSVNVSGNVIVGTGAELGTGSVVIPKLDIGEWSIAGAGSVITRPVPPDSTVAGVPAKVIKQRETGWHGNHG